MAELMSNDFVPIEPPQNASLPLPAILVEIAEASPEKPLSASLQELADWLGGANPPISENPEAMARITAGANVPFTIDLPGWMVEALGAEAAKLGIAREAIIKMWVNDRLRVERVHERYIENLMAQLQGYSNGCGLPDDNIQ